MIDPVGITPLIILNFVLLILLVVLALLALFSRNLLSAVVTLSMFSLVMATQYLVLGAPDVAITEAAVGAGVSAILFLLALSYTGEKDQSIYRPSFLALGAVFFTGVMLIYATLSMPAFRDANSPAMQHVSKFYVQSVSDDIGIPNIVTSILASYRGFDTLGEVAVVFTAGICVMMLLFGNARKLKRTKRRKA